MDEPTDLPLTDLPLSGIRVLDLSRLLPGPWCTQLLADLGAEVIKIETPLAGDYARLAPPELGFGGIFESVNRGKKSIAIDYRRPAGRRLLLRLVQTADVFLESSRPGQLERRGLGERAVRAANPRIVYCSLSGFGQTGPYRDRPGHDIDYLAVSGLLALLGPIGARPVPPGVQLADIAGGTLAALHIMAALCARERTGKGRVLDVAVLDAVTAWLGTLGPVSPLPAARPDPWAARIPAARPTARRTTGGWPWGPWNCPSGLPSAATSNALTCSTGSSTRRRSTRSPGSSHRGRPTTGSTPSARTPVSHA